jgi:hypothetical protein
MKNLTIILALLVLGTRHVAAQATMRLDYFHTGNICEELFSVDRIVIEPNRYGSPCRNPRLK